MVCRKNNISKIKVIINKPNNMRFFRIINNFVIHMLRFVSLTMF